MAHEREMDLDRLLYYFTQEGGNKSLKVLKYKACNNWKKKSRLHEEISLKVTQ